MSRTRLINPVNDFVLFHLLSSIVLLCHGRMHTQQLDNNHQNFIDSKNHVGGGSEHPIKYSVSENRDKESDEEPLHDENHENSYFFVGHPTGVAIHPQNMMQKPPLADQKSDDKVTDILHGLLTKYDNRIRPYSPDQPTLIEVSTLTLQVVNVDESKSEFATTLLLQQSWPDPRLVYAFLDHNNDVPYITVSHEHARDLWLPDTIFLNEKKAEVHEMTMTNDAVVLFRNGTVVRSTRITVSTHCPFTYEEFPFDIQKCELQVGSHGYAETDVKYFWNEKLIMMDAARETNVSWENIISDIHTGRFLATSLIFNQTTEKFKFGRKTCLSLQVTIKRSWRPFVTRFYLPLPLVLFVFVSLGTLFVYDAKVALIVNLFNMAFINIFIALRSSSDDTPKTSAKTALDEYFIICLVYILLVVLFTIYKLVKDRQKAYQVATSSSVLQSHLSVLPQNQQSTSFTPEQRRSQNRRRRNNADQLDIFNPMNNQQEEQSTNTATVNESENNCDETESEFQFQQIYRSPSYPLRLSSKTRMAWRKSKKLGFWLTKRLKWIFLATFLLTDYIYFKVHT